MEQRQTFTVITFHFGDIFWVKNLVNKIRMMDEKSIETIIIVDQSRNSQSELAQIPGVSEVITFEENQKEIFKLGHDHPSALNGVVRLESITTTHVLIFDSDCFPVREDWFSKISELGDVVLAQDPVKWGLSHPCFMKLPTKILSSLDFAEGALEIGIDTGRLIGLQISKFGLSPDLLIPQPAFNGFQGDLYLERSILHVGSSSFMFSKDARLTRQVDAFKKRLIQKKIKSGTYNFNYWERLFFPIIVLIAKVARISFRN